jgi:hypothetical protein
MNDTRENVKINARQTNLSQQRREPRRTGATKFENNQTRHLTPFAIDTFQRLIRDHAVAGVQFAQIEGIAVTSLGRHASCATHNRQNQYE